MIFSFSGDFEERNGNFSYFENRVEEPASSSGVLTQAEIADGLKAAMDNWKRMNSTFAGFGEKQERRKKRKSTTIPISPKLHTRTRLGKTRLEQEGEKLKKRRKQIFKMATKPRWA